MEKNVLLESIFNSLPLDIYVKDTNCRYQHQSRVSAEIRKKNRTGDVIGKTDFEVFEDPKFAQGIHEEDLKVLKTGKGLRRTVEMKSPDGTLEYYDIIKEPAKDGDGEVVGIIVVVIDVMENVTRLKQLEKENIYDSLTNLFNQRMYLRTAEHYINNPPKRAFVAVIDINNLKIINDIWGHSAGDDMINKTADLLRRVFDHDCQIFRTGGDEFSVIGHDWSDENIQEALGKANIEGRKLAPNKLFAGLSIGYSRIDSQHTFEEAIEIADDYMYFMKKYTKKHFNDRLLEILYEILIESGLDTSARYDRTSKMAEKLEGYFGVDNQDIKKIKKIIRYQYLTRINFSAIYQNKNADNNIREYDTKHLLATLTESDPLIFLIDTIYENWDGTGPRRMKRYEIPFYAQMVRLLTEIDERNDKEPSDIETFILSLSGNVISTHLARELAPVLN